MRKRAFNGIGGKRPKGGRRQIARVPASDGSFHSLSGEERNEFGSSPSNFVNVVQSAHPTIYYSLKAALRLIFKGGKERSILACVPNIRRSCYGAKAFSSAANTLRLRQRQPLIGGCCRGITRSWIKWQGQGVTLRKATALTFEIFLFWYNGIQLGSKV